MKDQLLAAGCPHAHCDEAAKAEIPPKVYEAGVAAGWDPAKILGVFQLLMSLSQNADVQKVINTVISLFQHAPVSKPA